MKKIFFTLFFVFSISGLYASYILIPMDDSQREHLKAYGIAYWVLEKDVKVDWLLNYRGGSFAFRRVDAFERECRLRGVNYEIVPSAAYTRIVQEISHPEANMDVIQLETPPKIAVYSPKTAQPWDDAVTLALSYAEIPYDVIYNDEILSDELPKYDWLHLHHEDFTGQYGKFYRAYRHAQWYKDQVADLESMAQRNGFSKVSDMKLGVVLKIRDFVSGGGFMFAMCSATDTYDIALAAKNVDIVDYMFDGDPPDPQAQEKLDFSNTLAFKDFQLRMDPYEYQHSTIDANFRRPQVRQEMDVFTLFEFSAKWDPVPTMLTQSHKRVIKGFMGQTTAFRKDHIKPNVTILGENAGLNEAKYIHGTFGYGMWTFYGGHDPEDYRHFVGDPPTDLSLHPTSPGYRLILNNVLFPAARKEKRKTLIDEQISPVETISLK
ncbi:MAG: asparagine synthetase B [Chitinophagaceae bacterium]|nr:MAG: asparagine synthetase B [Chitinophagaceae bacterium]